MRTTQAGSSPALAPPHPHARPAHGIIFLRMCPEGGSSDEVADIERSPRPRIENRRRFGALVLALLCAWIFGADARAQEPAGPSLAASSPWQGWYVEAGWLPLWVDLEGSDRDRQVDLRVRTARAIFTSPVELPAGARKRLPLVIWLDAADRPAGAASLELVDERGRQLASTRLPLEALGSRRLSVLVAGQEIALPAGLEAAGEGLPALRLAPEDLPEEALAWSAVDRVLLSGDAYPRLSPAQRRALERWTALGGHLLLAGGLGGSSSIEALPADWLPAAVGAPRELAGLPGLGSLAGRAPPAGPARILDLEPAADARLDLVSREGQPLAVSRSFGAGAIGLLAFDPSAPPLADWPGMASVWSALDRPRPGSAWREPPPDTAWMAAGLPPGGGETSSNWALALLALYTLAAGPLAHRLLARRGRLDRAWLVLPLLALLTSAVVLGLGRRTHSAAPRLYAPSALRLLPEAGLARATGYVGLVDGRSGPLEIRLEGGLARPADGDLPGPLELRLEAGASRLRLPSPAPGQPAGFAVDALIAWPAGQAAVGRGEGLRREDDRVAGRLRNPAGVALDDSLLLTAGGRSAIGRLGPDELTSIDMRYRPDSPVELDARGLRGHLVAAVLADPAQPASRLISAVPMRPPASPEAILIGFIERLPYRLTPDSGSVGTRAETLLYARLPLGLGGGMRFVDGLALRRSPDSAEACGPGAAVLTPEYAYAEFAFRLGEDGGIPEGLWLSMIGPGAELLAERDLPQAGTPRVRLALWDPSADAWLDFERIAAGESKQIPRLITRIEGRDQIRLRLTRDEEGLGPRGWEALRDACWEPRLAVVDAAPSAEAPDG